MSFDDRSFYSSRQTIQFVVWKLYHAFATQSFLLIKQSCPCNIEYSLFKTSSLEDNLKNNCYKYRLNCHQITYHIHELCEKNCLKNTRNLNFRNGVFWKIEKDSSEPTSIIYIGRPREESFRYKKVLLSKFIFLQSCILKILLILKSSIQALNWHFTFVKSSLLVEALDIRINMEIHVDNLKFLINLKLNKEQQTKDKT